MPGAIAEGSELSSSTLFYSERVGNGYGGSGGDSSRENLERQHRNENKIVERKKWNPRINIREQDFFRNTYCLIGSAIGIGLIIAVIIIVIIIFN